MSRAPELTVAAVLVLAATALYLPLAAEAAPAPSSLAGHLIGAAGFALMLGGTFGYSWRKRVRTAGPGAMRYWLDAHVVTGIAGPYLVLLHAGFSFHGLAGVLVLLVLVVVASGAVGKYAYTSMPQGRPEETPPEWTAAEGEDDTRAAEDGAVAVLAPPATRVRLTRAGGPARVAPAPARDPRRRRLLAVWWAFHVPVAVAMFSLGIVHVVAALYYATFGR